MRNRPFLPSPLEGEGGGEGKNVLPPFSKEGMGGFEFF